MSTEASTLMVAGDELAKTIEQRDKLRDQLDLTKSQFRELLIDYENQTAELASYRRQVKALKKQLSNQHKEDPLMSEAAEVFDHWRSVCRDNSAKVVFGEKRSKAVLSRLREHYTVADLKMAIDGAVVGAYVDPETSKKYDDLELICRNEVNVDRFIDLAKRAKRAKEPKTTETEDLISFAAGDLARMSVSQRLIMACGDPREQGRDLRFRCPVCRFEWWAESQGLTDTPAQPLLLREDGTLHCFNCHALTEDVHAELSDIDHFTSLCAGELSWRKKT